MKSMLLDSVFIDYDLLQEAIQVSGCETVDEVVKEGLKQLIKSRRRQNIRNLRGKIDWDDELNLMAK